MSSPNPTLALSRGLAVFPLPAGSKQAAPGWQARCTTDPNVIATSWPDGANIGVGCRASGIVGLDLDNRDQDADGIATFGRLCHFYGQAWPDTLTVATPHNGLHLYFAVAPAITIASTIHRWPGIDIRAPGRRTGGYLAGPGSVVPAGTYTVHHDHPILSLPPWLAELLECSRPTSTPLPP